MSMQDTNLIPFAICDYILSSQWHEMLRENFDQFEWYRVFRENLFHITGSQKSLKMSNLTLLLALHPLLDQHHNEIRRQRAQWWHSDTLSALLSLLWGESTGYRLPIPHTKAQWCRLLMFSLLLVWNCCWIKIRLACDLRRHCTGWASSCLVCAWVDTWRIYTYCRITLDI